MIDDRDRVKPSEPEAERAAVNPPEPEAEPAAVAQDEPRTISPDEAKQIAAAAYVRGQAAAHAAAKRLEPERSTPAGEPDPKRNQGSVVALVVGVAVVLVVLAGFGVLMWRLSKSESGIKTYLLEHL